MKSYQIAAVLCVAAATAVQGGADTLSPPNVMRSASGWVYVSGPTNVDNLATSKWAEDVARRTERITGLPIPFERRRPLRIQLRPESATGAPRAYLQPPHPGRGFDQRLVMEAYPGVAGAEAREALCRLLVNGYVARQVMTNPVPPKAWAPRFLAAGIAESLLPPLRARHSDTVLALQEAGRLPSAAEVLTMADHDGHSADDAVRASFVGWLSSFPGDQVRFGALFARIADGEDITGAWLAGIVPGCATAAELEIAWQEWVARQKQMVYVPGLTTPRMVRDLEAELLLTPGECSLPGAGLRPGMRFSDLVGLRSAKWVPTFVAAKSAKLKLMMVGRGNAFRRTVDTYCSFLDALARGKSERRLRKQLAAAQAALSELKAAVNEGEDARSSRQTPGR